MSTPINNGGKAFPDLHETGMSVRTYIATAAMAAILGREDTFSNGDRSEAGFPDSAEKLWREVARLAYQQADAMIAAGEAK